MNTGKDLALFMSYEAFSDKSVTDITYHQIEMLEDGRRGCKVEIIHLRNGQTEIDELVVTAIKTWQDGVMVVNPSFDIILYVEVYHARATDGDVVSIRQHLHVGVLHQFLPDGFLRRGGKVEDIALLLHNLKHANFREITLARGEGNLIVVVQEL